ncbi:hypothetical protein FRB94_009066 [Tulasnella sp. JGI-2019a]|nr:hypothetical protein FRB94_009066 [Tulasnella sp. JGI-2019a]
MSVVDNTADKPRYPCSECGAQYSRLEYLRRHERKHTEQRPFGCSDCPKSFARSDVLLRHRRRCHPESLEKDAAAAAVSASGSGKASKTRTRVSKDGRATVKRPRRVSAATTPDTPPSDESPSGQSIPTPPEAHLGTPADLQFTLAFDQSPASDITAISEKDAASSMLEMASSMPDSSWPQSSGSNSTMTISALMSPSLFPLFTGQSISSSLAFSNQNQNQNPNNQVGFFNSASPWSAMSNNLGNGPVTGLPPSMFDIDPFSGQQSHGNGQNQVWANPVVSMNPTMTMTEAELIAYLNGTAGDQTNELGLNIFQPERSLIDIEREKFHESPHGKLPMQALDPSDRFYLPPGVFQGCYTVPHWFLPPLYKMCRIASHTLTVLTAQMSIIHEPTFKLANTHGFTAFSMCTIGTKSIDFSTPVPTEQTYDSEERCKEPDPWKWLPSVIRTEKSDILMKNFARRGKMMSFAESFSLVQALIIFHTPSFLSDDPGTRITGLTFLTYIVQIARQVGLFRNGADWTKPVSILDWEAGGEAELDRRWKEWIDRETVRRTTWLVYVLDTIATIEAGTRSVTSPRDMRHLPLPAAPPIWNARTSKEWLDAMQKYPKVITLDSMLHMTFDLRTPAPPSNVNSPNAAFPIELAFAAPNEPSASGQGYAKHCLGTRIPMGPFARLCVVLTLLRGLIEFGEGKRKGGQVTQIWAAWPEPLDRRTHMSSHDIDRAALEESVLVTYKRAFDRWRMGWDIDRLCHWPYPSPTHPNPILNTRNPAYDASSPPPMAQCRESALMHDATPYFWLGTVLIDVMRTKLATPGVVPRPGVFGDLDEERATRPSAANDGIGMMGGSEEDEDDPRVNMFKGMDYRGMLDVAKQFAHSGEGI